MHTGDTPVLHFNLCRGQIHSQVTSERRAVFVWPIDWTGFRQNVLTVRGLGLGSVVVVTAWMKLQFFMGMCVTTDIKTNINRYFLLSPHSHLHCACLLDKTKQKACQVQFRIGFYSLGLGWARTENWIPSHTRTCVLHRLFWERIGALPACKSKV